MKRAPLYALASVAVLALGACTDQSPTATPEVNAVYNLDGEELPQEVTVCKVGPADSWASFTHGASPAGVGSFLVGSPFTVNAVTTPTDLSECVTVWKAVSPSDPTTNVTITEVDMTPGTVLNQIIVFSSNTPTIGSNFVSVDVNFSQSAYIIFKNIEDDTPPPPSGQGCTPGYWKAHPHWDSWPATGYSTGQSFESAFGVNAFPGMSLLDVLGQGGGHLNALGRHAVASLLNAAHPDVSSGLVVSDVISMFQAAYASGNYETTKNLFEAVNEQGCSID